MSSSVPDGWSRMNFGDLTESIKSGLSRRIVSQDIGIPVLISGNIQNNRLDTTELKYWHIDDPQGANTSRYILNGGDILLCFINSVSQIGKVCIFQDIGRPAIYTTNLFRLVAHPNYSSSFVYQLMTHSSFQGEIQLITKPAVNQASFTKGDLEGIPVAVPPLPEQKKIASILSSVDNVIEKTQAQIDKLSDLKTGMMQELLTKGIDHTEFKDSPVGRIPVGWEVGYLEDVVERIFDCEHKTAPYVDDSEYLVVRTSNVRHGELIHDDMKFTTEDGFKEWTKRAVPSIGDVLFTREAPAGESCMVPDRIKVCMGQRMVLLRPNNDVISPIYFSIYLTSEIAELAIYELSIGTTVARINIEDIKKIPCILPSVVEQKRISATILSIQTSIATKQSKLKSMRSSKKALMQDLLTGNVRVKVDQ